MTAADHSPGVLDHRNPISGELTAVQAGCDCAWRGEVIELPAGWGQDQLTDAENRVIGEYRGHLKTPTTPTKG